MLRGGGPHGRIAKFATSAVHHDGHGRRLVAVGDGDYLGVTLATLDHPAVVADLRSGELVGLGFPGNGGGCGHGSDESLPRAPCDRRLCLAADVVGEADVERLLDLDDVAPLVSDALALEDERVALVADEELGVQVEPIARVAIVRRDAVVGVGRASRQDDVGRDQHEHAESGNALDDANERNHHDLEGTLHADLLLSVVKL